MKEQWLTDILDDVPDYQAFLTVDELKDSARRLVAQYPDVVELMPIGQSRQEDPIEALKIGCGSKKGLIFALPHPNEPIGSMMLEYLSRRLAEDGDLRRQLDYTWYLIKCIDPDGTRLNEGWFKGPFSIENYGRHYYRPPSHLQIEWTFPIDYKNLQFDQPLPETRALMGLIEEIRPDFIYSLHNAGFGGAYFYMSEAAAPLFEPFYELVESQGLHLHLGEPEIVWVEQFADAIFATPSITNAYDFLESQGVDPKQAISGGTSSFDYARRYCDPFSLICEMPYFDTAAIHDTSESDMVRREAILQGISRSREGLGQIKAIYTAVKEELTAPNPFVISIDSFLQSIPPYLSGQENWARTEAATAAPATIAQKLDNLTIRRFYVVLLSLGMVMRMIETQIAASGASPVLSAALSRAEVAFGQICAEIDSELEYHVVPIRKLVNVQLGSALLAARYAAGRDAGATKGAAKGTAI
ncbi:MAG: M14 family zinc carboxypeptidase [Candidatus Promineifilaceae bacterium]|nr:M14 family zinc carboxypeptidase [Candidatus Promineifilaceae bacterium]